MSFTILGLDLGISSIGWALVREEKNQHHLIHWGSRIFQPEIDAADKGVSRCATRRKNRALRTQHQRNRERKENLIAALIDGGLLQQRPDAEFFEKIDRRLLKEVPENSRKVMGHLIPYFYRKAALDRPLKAEEAARAIFHLAQRRGYRSNRKFDLKSDDTGKVKDGIRTLQTEICSAGARTLGEYFCSLDPERARIRSRHYTSREMYLEEFRLICSAQRHLISEELERKLYKAIFYQRPLKSCKHLIGHCRKYPELKRCSFAREEAQLFRIYSTVRNLRIEKNGVVRSLTEEEWQKTIGVLDSYSPLFNQKGKITLNKLQRAIGLERGEKFTLGDGEKEIYGNELKNILFRAFGEKASELPESEKQKFFNDLGSITKENVLQKRLQEYWMLSEEKAAEIARSAMPDDYCAFSRKALQEMLPDLAAGVDLPTLLKLDQTQVVQPIHDLLPLVDDAGLDLRNPVVHRVLTELRRVVNAIIRRYGKPDRIRIELARDLKSTNQERARMTSENSAREKERQKIAQRIIAEVGIPAPSRNDILKVLLAEECNYECPYSGTHFGMRDLFNGMIEIEHIIPYSRSFDDSFANKTLCHKAYNQLKSNRTPFEAFGGSAEYPAMLERVRRFKGKYAERKLELFKRETVEPEDFLSRSLNDTRYASKLAMQYLGKLYGGIVDREGRQRIFAVAGGCTAAVRRVWGGNYLLGEGEKKRDDHRHHAIDALTIALTTPEIVKYIAEMTPEERRKHREEKQFRNNTIYQQAFARLGDIAVSHHTVNKLRGELHKATFFSRNHESKEGVVHHKRISLRDLDVKHVKAIVDPAIKKIILEKLGVVEEKQITAEMLKIFQDESNFPQMLDRHGNPVNTIKNVRIREKQKTRTIGSGDGRREVANGENYILAIFARLDENGNETGWEGEIVTLLDAVQRHQKKMPIFEKERPGMKFKFSLQKGDIITWEKNGQEQLCVIRVISLPQFSFVSILDARIKTEIQAAGAWNCPTLSGAFRGKMKKYNMNIFGELQIAND